MLQFYCVYKKRQINGQVYGHEQVDDDDDDDDDDDGEDDDTL